MIWSWDRRTNWNRVTAETSVDLAETQVTNMSHTPLGVEHRTKRLTSPTSTKTQLRWKKHYVQRAEFLKTLILLHFFHFLPPHTRAYTKQKYAFTCTCIFYFFFCSGMQTSLGDYGGTDKDWPRVSTSTFLHCCLRIVQRRHSHIDKFIQRYNMWVAEC